MGQKRALFVWFLLFFCSSGSGFAQINAVRQSYISQYKNLAISQMQEYGIPASIALAQACLETGFGTSRLAKEANNHFGIKCHSDWKGATIKQTDDAKDECFRKYKSPLESFKDYAAFLRYRDRYAFLFDLSPYDYKGWAQGLKKAGYATDPLYAELLIKIIEDYSLFQYDRAVSSLPVPPAVLEKPVIFHPDTFSPLYTASLHRTIYQRNHVSYILSLPGDTYSSLSKEFRLFKCEILRFNDLKKGKTITPGTLVYVAQKKKQSTKELPVHIAESGESLRDIAQRYGVRLSYIRKYNKMSPKEILLEGRLLNLRKP